MNNCFFFRSSRAACCLGHSMPRKHVGGQGHPSLVTVPSSTQLWLSERLQMADVSARGARRVCSLHEALCKYFAQTCERMTRETGRRADGRMNRNLMPSFGWCADASVCAMQKRYGRSERCVRGSCCLPWSRINGRKINKHTDTCIRIRSKNTPAYTWGK